MNQPSHAKPTPWKPLAYLQQNGAAFFSFFFVVEVVHAFVVRVQKGYTREGWNITEWLINYQGGFVRRGLPGEVLYRLHQWMGVSPYGLIIVFCVAAYLGLILYFYRSFRGEALSTRLLPCTFFLGGPVINDFWARKDILMIVLLIFTLKAAVTNHRLSFVFANLIFVVALLVHETIGFYGLPVLVAIFYYQGNHGFSRGLNFTRALLKAVPSLGAFAFVLYHKGSALIAEMIWSSWSAVRFPRQDLSVMQPPGALDGLSWSLGKALSYSKDTLTNFNADIYGPLAWLFILLLIYSVTVHSLPRRDINAEGAEAAEKGNVGGILLFQLLAVAPLFVLGWDYGRWVFLWVSSSLAIYLVVPPQMLAELLPAAFGWWSEKVDRVCAAAFGDPTPLLGAALLLIGVPASGWSLQEYVLTTPAYFSMRLLSLIIQKSLAGLHLLSRSPGTFL